MKAPDAFEARILRAGTEAGLESQERKCPFQFLMDGAGGAWSIQ